MGKAMVLQCLPPHKRKSTTQVPTGQASESPFSLRQRSRTCSLSLGSLGSLRAVTRARPPSLCIHAPAQPGVSTTRVHAESPSRSYVGDDWYLNKSNVPSTPPSSPLIESVRHNEREIFLVTGVRERLQSFLPSSRPFRGSSDETYIEFTDEKAPSIRDSHTSLSSQENKLILQSQSAGLSSFLRSFEMPESQNADIYSYFLVVLTDKVRYERFLSHRNGSAQILLDTLQTLLDHHQRRDRLRLVLCVAIVRLTRKSGRYPQRFDLLDIVRQKDPVAEGSYGEVYKGSYRGMDICIKVVRVHQKTSKELQALLYKAFYREAVLWGQLSHPNILPFLGIYHLKDSCMRIGLVSPWMKNGNIIQFLGKCPNADRHMLALDTATGLRYLHENGVVHGDLTPANVLVNDSNRACLVDFGLSTVDDLDGLKGSVLSSANPPGGAARRFSAPELADPDVEYKRNKKSDVFSLGMVLYQILTGKTPFGEVKNDCSVLLMLRRGDRPPRPGNNKLSDNLWRLIEDCWAHDPSNRPHAHDIVCRLSQGLEEDRRLASGWRNSSSQLNNVSIRVSLHELRHILEAPTVA